MTIVHQMMRQGISRRAHPYHQYLPPRRGSGQRPVQVERIPPRDKAINFKAPGQLQHILQSSRFSLGNIDRLLLLVNAGFHAIIANPVPGTCAHGIVHHNHGETAHRDTLGLELVELGDALLQRTTGKQDAELAFLE